MERGRIQEDCHRNKSAIEIEEKKGNCSRKRRLVVLYRKEPLFPLTFFCLVQCLTESSTEIRPLLILLEMFARLADEPCFPHISHSVLQLVCE